MIRSGPSERTGAEQPRQPEASSTTPLAVDEVHGRAPAYVDREGVSLRHFVNRYIRTRRRPVNSENRLIVQQAMGRYRGNFPASCAALEAFLDSILLVTTAKPAAAGTAQDHSSEPLDTDETSPAELPSSTMPGATPPAKP